MRKEAPELSAFRTRLIEWAGSYRLIPSRFPPVELYAPVAPVDDWDALKRIEDMTNPRLRERSGAFGKLLPEDRGRVEQNWLVAPFTYPDPEPSLFSDGSFGVCIVAEALETALLMSVKRRETFLKRTAEPPTQLDMRVLKAPISARLHDLTTFADREDATVMRSVTNKLRADKSYGLILQGPRGGKDRIAAILRPTAFQPAIQTQHFRYVWNGERIYQIYDYAAGVIIDPNDLTRSSAQDAA
jgi:hypothetical protein